MNDQYYLTLEAYDERCLAEAEQLGLPVPETLFHVLQAEEIYDIAARSLPGRYSHYQFGRSYEQQKGDYDKGRGRIYELVINTRPVHAYLLDGNSPVAQLLVIAHVLGHAVMFEHNRYFKPADKNILSRVRSAAERIDAYIADYGRDTVEDFIDSCETLQYQRSFDQLAAGRAPAPEPVWTERPHDVLFPEETAQRRKRFEEARARYKTHFPREPQRDLLAFIEKHAGRLENWQRDVISIIRTEMDYFIPQMRTQVLNEASAVFYHQTILQKLMAQDDRFTTDDFMEFQGMNARVLHPKIQMEKQQDGSVLIHCTGINPYLAGSVIFTEVKRLCENPTGDERERWPHWAGVVGFDEKRNELIQAYDDAALLAEFLSPSVCEQAKLFMRPRTPVEYRKLRVSQEECDAVRAELVKQKTTFGVPVIEITDADYQGRGELLLEHRHEGVGLDDEYTKGTLTHLLALWGRPVTVRTVAVTDAKANVQPGEKPEVHDVWYRAEKPGVQPVRRTAAPA